MFSPTQGTLPFVAFPCVIEKACPKAISLRHKTKKELGGNLMSKYWALRHKTKSLERNSATV